MKKIIKTVLRGLLLRQREEGRYILERKIFPKLKNKKVLFAGVAHYTADYPKKLKSSNLWTIDIDPSVEKYGARNHVIGDVAEANKFFPESFFDVIILSGIFGYGVNDSKAAEKVMKNCWTILKKNGKLVIQWSDRPNHDQVNPRKLKNFGLFIPVSFGKYNSPYRTKKNNRVFEFLVKK